MKELIYVFDEPVPVEVTSAEPDSQVGTYAKAAFSGALSAVASAVPSLAGTSVTRSLGLATLGANPMSLVLGLAVTSGPLLYTLYKSKDKDLSPEEAKLLELEISNLKVTSSKAKELGYSFPPGHPRSGVLYQRHPLANYVSTKKLSYIPEQQYESVLTEERQSELIRLLTELGATKIEISESYNDENENGSTKSVTTSASSLELEASIKNERNGFSRAQILRSFKLRGKKWASDQELNVTPFNWYDFEPQWQSLVYTRSFGGCIEATIDMREEQSLISGSELALALKSELTSANNGLEGASQSRVKSNQHKSYIINIEFGDPEVQA